MSTEILEQTNIPSPVLTGTERTRALFLDTLTVSFLMGVVVWLFLPPIDRDNFDFPLALQITAATLAAGLLTAFLIQKMGFKTMGITMFSRPDPNAPTHGIFTSFWGMQTLVVLLTMVIVGSFVTEVSLYELVDEKGLGGAGNILKGFTQPNTALLPEAILAIVQTIFSAFIATIGAIPIAFILSFFAAKNVMGKTRVGTIVYMLLRTFFNLTRSIEPVSWAIIFSVWVGVGPFAGMLALFLHSVASLTKQYSEQIECVSDGPIEGIQATGASYLQVVWFAIVPQVVLPFVSFTVYRWDINVRMATIVGLTGGGGIGTLLFQYQNQANWHAVGMLVIVIAVVVWIMDTSSAYIREALK